jgi:transcriptional regulator with XRE-family HTH domain
VDAEGTMLAHFYTFGEIYYGKTYVFDKVKQTGDWSGDPVTLPAVFPMTPVPLGGYPGGVPAGVANCDKIFTKMLQQLDHAWTNGDDSALGDAINSMLALKPAAIALLKQQIPRTEGGIYGPQFRKASFHFEFGGIAMNLGKSIKLCRTNRGLSQGELAGRIGLSVSYISLIEQGKRDPAISTVEEISDALGVPLSVLTFLAADPGDLKGLPEDVRDKLAGVAFKLLHAKQRA